MNPKFLDRIKQYISGFTTNGGGFVHPDVNPQFKAKASPDEYAPAPTPSPTSRLMDSIKNMGGSQAFAGEIPQERQDSEQAAMISEFQKMGWDIPQDQPAVAGAQDGFQGYINDQAVAQANPSDIEYLLSTLLPLTRAKGIPDALPAGHFAGEGGRTRGTNPFGLMWPDEQGNRRLHPYESLSNAVDDYDLTLRNIASDNMGVARDQFDYSNFTPEEILRFLQYTEVPERQDPRFPGQNIAATRYEYDSPDPLQYVDFIPSTPEYRHFR